ncbi:MAG: formylglycine-generating enzyme family protein [Fimbriiglobus sp.]|jgi:formylglycine-generating enzyme required for sulfatase activity|nr:formylglycine-generating enzyme family protein [Fimbriiglobus sp.]
MSRAAPPPKKSPWSFVPFVLGGVVIGLVVVLAVLSNKPGPFDPLAEADSADPPMANIPGGTFIMGSDTGPDDERPAHAVTLRPFRIDVTEVTNAQFARFVKATGYKTIAERTPTAEQYPDAPPERLRPGSATFVAIECSTDPRTWDTPHPPWWRYTFGANWRHPTGPGSDLRGKMKHPVVHIAWADAVAYAEWAGKRLPTEAEWEYAARGGLDRQEFCWGGEKQGDGGKFFANTFQGVFPHIDTAADGFVGLAPVRSFPPNGYGLFDMSGNAWEWCSDWYDSGYYRISPKDNPTGPDVGEPDGGMPQRVRRGGSFLCADGYCRRYLPAARDKNPEDSGASHTGFRCVKD